MQGIFISYRHDDSKAWAALLGEALVSSFGADRVYLDKDTQRAGPWREQVQAGLARSKVVLVVIGPHWLTATDKDGRRLLDDPNDVLRQEIDLALKTPGVTVIPVRMDGAPRLRAQDLPADIRGLVDQQWRDVSDVRVHRQLDIGMLVEDIEKATGLVARKPPQAGGGWRSQLKLLGSAAVLTVLALTLGPLLLNWPPMDTRERLVVFVLVLLLLHFCVWMIRLIKRRQR